MRRGHSALNNNSFSRDAQKKTEEAFKGLNGVTFTGSGATQADAATAARTALGKEINKRSATALSDLIKQAAVLGDKYDDLTNHGLNNKGNIDSTQKGVDAALGERDKAPKRVPPPLLRILPSRTHPQLPTPPPFPMYAASGALLFGGDLLQCGRDPLDPLLGRGRVSVDPMLLIGLSDNGSYHLTDTELRITDAVTGIELLTAA